MNKAKTMKLKTMDKNLIWLRKVESYTVDFVTDWKFKWFVLEKTFYLDFLVTDNNCFP